MNFLLLIIVWYFYDKYLFYLTKFYYCKKNFGIRDIDKRIDRIGKCKCWHCKDIDSCIFSKWYQEESRY